MKAILRALPVSLRERPFDFYAVFVLFLVGVYGIVDDNFPERWQQPITSVFINVISAYLIVASLLVISSLLCNKKERPVYGYMSEFLGWMLICAASVAASLLYIASVIGDSPQSWIIWFIWLLIWVGMSIASFIRTYDLYIITRRNK
jgi:drug/metabolite transporter (DMT)-like permease